MHHVMLLVRQIQCGKELWPIAAALRDSKQYACTVVVGREALQFHASARKLINHYAAEGFPVINYDDQDLSAEGVIPERRAQRSRLRSWLYRVRIDQGFSFGLRSLLEFVGDFRYNRRSLRVAKRLLARRRPDVVVMQEYGHLCMEAILVKTARERGIATLMVPSADNGQIPEVSLQGFLASDRAARVDTRQLHNAIVAKFFPRWVRVYRGVHMLRYSAAESLAAWCAGLMSPDPWLPNRWVQYRATLCERSRDDILRYQGFSPAQLVVTGQAALDASYRTWQSADHMRTTVFASLGLDDRKRTILFSIPPLVPHRLLSDAQQKTFTEFVLRTMAGLPDTQVVLSMWVGGDAAEYAPMAEQYGAVIAHHVDVKELIALCDLAVNVRSSITWTAIACQKPTLALDFWGMGHVSFYECPGVILVERREDLGPTLRRVLLDKTTYRALVEQLRAVAPIWSSCFDGHATDRIITLIDTLVSGMPRGTVADARSPETLNGGPILTSQGEDTACRLVNP